MNGAQDLGGQNGFGPVIPEAETDRFHAEWEKRVLAVTLAMGATGMWNIDMSRHARESMPPAEYLASTYYEIWYAGLVRLLVQKGLADREEIATGILKSAGKTLPRKLEAGRVVEALAKGAPVERDANAPAKFAVGHKVRTLVTNPRTHTRLPRYARGRPGRVERIHGVHVFADSNAHGLGEDPQWLYSVSFRAEDVWGSDGRTGDEILIDIWEPCLVAA
jgi:nitrile hydratase